MRAVFETSFDILYLTFVTVIGILMIKRSRPHSQYRLFGWMAIVLGAGDAFHLIPRAYALCTTGLENYTAALGVGKWITSITMTIFYVLLFEVWKKRYGMKKTPKLNALVYGLALVRIVLCMFPQNEWLNALPPIVLGIIRNVPFALLGAVIILLFAWKVKETRDRAFRWMALTIVLSFAFYIPVVLWAEKIPMIGMLMIPKTCAYMWTIWIGYEAMKKSRLHSVS